MGQFEHRIPSTLYLWVIEYESARGPFIFRPKIYDSLIMSKLKDRILYALTIYDSSIMSKLSTKDRILFEKDRIHSGKDRIVYLKDHIFYVETVHFQARTV